MELSIIIPVFNEEDSINEIIDRIKSVMRDTDDTYEILVVNDGSTDNSKAILEAIQGIKLINHVNNLGYGASLKTAIMKAKYDFVLITDADGTYPIEDIPKLTQYLDRFDMAVGARIKTRNVSFSKRIAKWIITKTANMLSKNKIPDINSGFRVFKKEAALKFFNLYPDGFSFTTTITLVFLMNNYRVKYIPIEYHKRKGKSKMKPKEFFGFLNLLLNIMMYFNPLRIFSMLSFFLFLVGIAIFLYSLLFLNKVLDITVTIILLSSLQVFILGLIADLIIRRGSK